MVRAALADEFDVDVPVIEAVQAGDRYAFADLVQRHGSWVRAVVFGVLGRSDGIDDVVQQVWASVWQRVRELRDPARWRPWLYRMARNAAVDAGREISRRRRLLKSASDGVLDGRPGHANGGNLVSSERHKTVMAAINGLPALYREPFVLRHLNDWSYQQIADVMDMPVDSVETRLVRARRLLREALEDKVGL